MGTKAANKAKSPSLSMKRRYWLVTLLVLAIHQSFSYSRGPECLYFPFERWPAGGIKHAMPPPVRHGQVPTIRQAKFANLTEALVFRYMRFYKQNRFNPEARKLIYTSEGNSSGFGDRFRGILYTYQLALLSQLVLLISWQEPFPIDLLFKSAPKVSVFYDPRIDPGPLPVSSWIRGRRRTYPIPTVAKPLPFCACNLEEPGILLSREKVVVVRTQVKPSLCKLREALRTHAHLPAAREQTPALKDKSMSSSSWLRGAIFSLIFRELLQPAPPLIARLASMREELRAIVPSRLRVDHKGHSRGYIAVHARIGYGVGEGKIGRFNLAKKGANITLIASCLAKSAAEEAGNANLPEPQIFFTLRPTRRSSPPRFDGRSESGANGREWRGSVRRFGTRTRWAS